MIFDKKGEVKGVNQKEHVQHFPAAGHVEHDPEEIWKNTKSVIEAAMREANIKASQIAALGITNQRETTVVWNKLDNY